ncbi:MAG: hypothetical protein KDA61_16005, partial [Planctomycetales bacterium]|nr:hypothetical protein [Planctomycetales bacterium]
GVDLAKNAIMKQWALYPIGDRDLAWMVVRGMVFQLSKAAGWMLTLGCLVAGIIYLRTSGPGINRLPNLREIAEMAPIATLSVFAYFAIPTLTLALGIAMERFQLLPLAFVGSIATPVVLQLLFAATQPSEQTSELVFRLYGWLASAAILTTTTYVYASAWRRSLITPRVAAASAAVAGAAYAWMATQSPTPPEAIALAFFAIPAATLPLAAAALPLAIHHARHR